MASATYRDIEVRGVSYATVAECAKKLRVSEWNVRRAIRSNRLETLGLGAVHVGRVTGVMPVRIGGMDFPSQAAAAKHFGCDPSTISKAIDDGDPDRVLRGRSQNRNHVRPVVLGGIAFPSMAAASRALGCSNGYVSQVLSSGSRRRHERMIGLVMAYAARQTRAA